MESQKINPSNTNVQRIEIKSLEQMESFLENLKATASDSLSAALSAQLQVIRYVSSAQLVGATFDTLFQNLKKAKEYATTPKERDAIMERGSLMIQNYVFFMRARLVYAIEDNKEEGRKLFEEAGKQLSKNVVEIVAMYATGGASLSVTVSKNLFQNAEQYLSLVNKFLNWWNKEQINAEKQQEFYKSIELLISKLNKRKDIIGQSNLIAGLVENYAEDLTGFATAEYYAVYVDVFNKKEKILKQFWTAPLGVLSISIVFLCIRWFWHLMQDVGAGMMSWFSDDVEKITRDGWVATHFMWTSGYIVIAVLIVFIIFLVRRRNFKTVEKAYVERYNEVRDYYRSIAESFEE